MSDYLPASAVRARYGGICDQTLSRWLKDPTLGFPRPLVIRRQRRWHPADLDAFDAARIAA